MPRKPPKHREDAAETAYRVFQEAVRERPKSGNKRRPIQSKRKPPPS